MLDRNVLNFHGKVELYPGQDNLEIAYAGLSFIKPEHVQFKYRLEGVDSGWVEAGNRRVAYFSYLPPGNYTFHVIAANSDGVWNDKGARFSFIVHPPLWQTLWFRAAIGLAVLTIIAFLYRARVGQLKRAQETQEAFAQALLASQESERRRIATGLHDSLGQQLLVIKNWAMLSLGMAKEDHPAREGLSEISTTASQAIEEVREIIYDLRPYQLDKIGLASTIQFMIEKVAAASDIKFDVRLGKIDNLLSYDREITLYRVVQEGVNNIVKHSQASEALVAIEPNGQQLNLTIEDNGRGFAPETVIAGDFRRGGLGLSGISERVRILGGKHSIQSTPGGGTRILISIDLTRGK